MRAAKQTLVWRGETWKLYSDGYWRIGGRYLHREKWEHYRGPIPKGWVVHHKDHDRGNHRISNLECMSRGQHSAHHAPDVFGNPEVREKSIASNRRIAKATGKKVSASLLSRALEERLCKQCGDTYFTRSVRGFLCGPVCRWQYGPTTSYKRPKA